MNTAPTAVAAAISAAAKAILLAVVAVGLLPWTETQVAAVTLAAAQLVELGVIFGLIRPRVTPVAAPKDYDGAPLVRRNDG